MLSNALLKWWRNINFLTMAEEKIRRFPAESQPNGSILHAVLLQASDMLVLKSCHAESTQNWRYRLCLDTGNQIRERRLPSCFLPWSRGSLFSAGESPILDWTSQPLCRLAKARWFSNWKPELGISSSIFIIVAQHQATNSST